MHEVTRKLLGAAADEVVFPLVDLAERLNTMVLDEQIWGNRLRADQKPWAVFLEFLTVAEYYWRKNPDKLFDPASGTSPQQVFRYAPHSKIHLRILLFNEQDAETLSRSGLDPDAAWEQWRQKMKLRYTGRGSYSFDYLAEAASFEEFKDFARVLNMLRDAVVHGEDKRWTSRFLFPFGTNALYEDIGIKPTGELDRNYIYFGHTGELLYLMVCRSKHQAEIAARFRAFFEREDPCDKLIKILLSPESNGSSKRGGGYLPYRSHYVYNDLGEDWLQVLKLGGLSVKDKLEHLAHLSALHLMRFQLLVSSAVMRKEGKTAMICEILGPRPRHLRQLSVRSFEANKSLSTKTISAYLRAIESSEQWQDAQEEDDAVAACRRVLKEIVGWDPKEEVHQRPGEVLEELREAALKRHSDRSAALQRTYGQWTGLVSRRGTNRYRYAPTDALLRRLVLANVSRHMEFGEFLERLWRRYGLVIGQEQAAQVLPRGDYDSKAFQDNARRLERRLGGLGLVRRLSDACAYVINPYSSETMRPASTPSVVNA